METVPYSVLHAARDYVFDHNSLIAMYRDIRPLNRDVSRYKTLNRDILLRLIYSNNLVE